MRACRTACARERRGAVWCELAAVLLLLAARSHRSPIGSAKTKKVRQPSFVAGGVGTLRKTERRGVANISKGAQSVTPNDQTNSSTLLTHLGDENANANQCAISRARHPKVFSGLTQRHLALVTPHREGVHLQPWFTSSMARPPDWGHTPSSQSTPSSPAAP